ncbi:MAG: peptidase M14 [Rudanella sp.]|nr:peptidase M14 [Rudanella sp.]
MSVSPTFAQDAALPRQLYNAHPSFQETTLTHRRFKHSDIQPLLNRVAQKAKGTTVEPIGESTEKRVIRKVQAGTGPTPVLLWSQMHGDEATATMALFDIINFLQTSGDEWDEFRANLLAGLTIHFVPMLNPDGAERWQRRTALDIDMNRDALRLQSPESVILKNLQQTLKPLVGFNLHDQNPRYGVGKTGKQAVLSFLATAYDEDRNLNEIRQRSMQLIAGLNRVLQPFIPGQIARYDDEFEARAFGDNIQKWGTTLILIESGGYKGDTEKMMVRRLNFVAILSALNSIANRSYEAENVADYTAIPENGRALFDVLIRNVGVVRNGVRTVMDVGINQYEENTNNARDFRYESKIEDLGDLSTFFGLQEIDATGLELVPATVYPETLKSIDKLTKLNVADLRQQGTVVFRLKKANSETAYKKLGSEPVHVLVEGDLPAQPLELGQVPTFLLKEGDQVKYVVVNGLVMKGGEQSPGKRFIILD